MRTKVSETECLHGHPRTPENTGPRAGGYTYCKPCLRARNTTRAANAAKGATPEETARAVGAIASAFNVDPAEALRMINAFSKKPCKEAS